MEIDVTPTELPACRWGEGSLWHDGHLLFVDIENHRVHRYDPRQGADSLETWEIGERVGFVVPRLEAEELIIGTDNGLFFLDPVSGETRPISDPEPDRPDNRFNDGKCSPDGRLFAGTISLVKKEGDARLYRLDPDLGLHEAFSPVTNSNGIVWSGDGKTCWYIDTPRRAVLGFDYDAETGSLRSLRTAVDTSHIDASPDGMTIDEEDKIWVAFCHGGCVVRFDPESGEELLRVEIPALETTSCAFGGENLDELYVTTGVHKSVEEELGGRTFRVTGLGVRGVPSHSYAG